MGGLDQDVHCGDGKKQTHSKSIQDLESKGCADSLGGRE